MTFELPVTEEKVKPHQVTALHLLASLTFVGSGAIFLWLYAPTRLVGMALLIIGVLLLGISIFKNKWLVSGSVNKTFRIAELVILLCLLTFTAMQRLWVPTSMFGVLGAAILFALYWEGAGNDPLLIRIDGDGIRLPLTSRRRFIGWVEVEKVLLRFGTLTVDCHNQRFFQWNIHNPAFDTEIFEAFCDSKIEENRSKRITDDW